jgi:hypothetical protein
MVFSIFQELGNHDHNLILEHCHHPLKESGTHSPLSSPRHPEPSPSPQQHQSIFCPCTFHINGITHFVCSLWSEDFQILCVPQGRMHGRTRGCKWSLLKVREGKYKRGHGGTRWKVGAERESFSFPGAFKTYANLWEGKNLVIPNQ